MRQPIHRVKQKEVHGVAQCVHFLEQRSHIGSVVRGQQAHHILQHERMWGAVLMLQFLNQPKKVLRLAAALARETQAVARQTEVLTGERPRQKVGVSRNVVRSEMRYVVLN